jgi:hypothetical protein
MTESFYTQEAWEQAAKALEAISSQEYLVTPSVTPVENLPRKTYKCPTKNCSKVYKNSNGLKYHLEKGTCVASRDVSPDSSPSIQHFDKPFYCKLGCVKYYRNINGLKYHARIEHATLDFEKDVKGVVSCLMLLTQRLTGLCNVFIKKKSLLDFKAYTF